jgi:hypothetical protein
MNNNLFEEKWDQIRSQTPAWWSLMSDQDLEKVNKAEVKMTKYVTLLQVKYGYMREEAKKEISKRLKEFESEQRTAQNG